MRFKKLVVPFILLAFLVGCATFGYKSFTDWTPKQKADYFMRVYLSEAKNADMVLKDPLATPAKKAEALKNKEILIQTYPLIKTYVAVVDSGGVPLILDEQQIMGLIDKLIDLL